MKKAQLLFNYDIFQGANLNPEVIQIFVAILIGLIIGAEREYQNKSAGLRTFILVSFGACIFTILSIEIGIGNPDRLAANIITGIGFLGAGVIFKDDNKVGGITTATTIWATASLGMAVGSGHIVLALFGTAIVMVILRLLVYLQTYIDNHHKIRDYRIVTVSEEDFEYCKELFKSCNLKFAIMRQMHTSENTNTSWRITGRNINHQALIKQLKHNPHIISYQF